MNEIHPNYKNAPLIEAVIDIQFNKSELASEEIYNSIYNLIKEEYPVKKKQVLNELNINIENDSSEPSLITKSEIEGIRCISKDTYNVIQITAKRLTLSRLKPYTNWNSIISEYQKIWKLYEKLLKPKIINRIGLRYINKFPCPNNDFDGYLQIKTTLGQNKNKFYISGFSQRYLFYFPDYQANSIINIIVESNKTDKINSLSIIFDIDVFNNYQIEPEWERALFILNNLRVIKNDLFEANIGEKAKKEFKGEDRV